MNELDKNKVVVKIKCKTVTKPDLLACELELLLNRDPKIWFDIEPYNFYYNTLGGTINVLIVPSNKTEVVIYEPESNGYDSRIPLPLLSVLESREYLDQNCKNGYIDSLPVICLFLGKDAGKAKFKCKADTLRKLLAVIDRAFELKSLKNWGKFFHENSRWS